MLRTPPRAGCGHHRRRGPAGRRTDHPGESRGHGSSHAHGRAPGSRFVPDLGRDQLGSVGAPGRHRDSESGDHDAGRERHVHGGLPGLDERPSGTRRARHDLVRGDGEAKLPRSCLSDLRRCYQVTSECSPSLAGWASLWESGWTNRRGATLQCARSGPPSTTEGSGPAARGWSERSAWSPPSR